MIKCKYDKNVGVIHVINARVVQIKRVGGCFMGRPNHATVAQGVFPSQHSYQEHLFVSAVICITVGKLGTLGEVASLAVLCARGLAAESEVESLSTDGVDEFVGSAVEQLPLIHITGPLLHAHLLPFTVNQAKQFSESLFANNKCHDKSL